MSENLHLVAFEVIDINSAVLTARYTTSYRPAMGDDIYSDDCLIPCRRDNADADPNSPKLNIITTFINLRLNEFTGKLQEYVTAAELGDYWTKKELSWYGMVTEIDDRTRVVKVSLDNKHKIHKLVRPTGIFTYLTARPSVVNFNASCYRKQK